MYVNNDIAIIDDHPSKCVENVQWPIKIIDALHSKYDSINLAED